LGETPIRSSQHSWTIREIVEETVRWIRSRHYPERPHISLVGPPKGSIVKKIWTSICRETSTTELIEDEEEMPSEDIEEILRYGYPGWIFGATLRMKRQELGGASFSFNFYVRVAPDSTSSPREDSYAKVEVAVLHNEKEEGRIEVKLSKTEENSVNRSLLFKDPGECKLLVVVVGDMKALSKLDLTALSDIIKRQFSLPREKLEIETLKLELPDDSLTAPFSYGKNETELASLRQVFAIVSGYCGDRYRAYLLNLGGLVESSSEQAVQQYCERPHRTYIRDKLGDEKWAIGYLLEVEGSLEFKGGWESDVKWSGLGLMGAYPANTMIILDQDEKILFKDYVIEEEVLYEIKRGSNVRTFLSNIVRSILASRECKNGRELFKRFVDALAESLESKGISELYTFQEKTTQQILSSLDLVDGEKHKAVVIMSRTAGGKTFAFLIPTLVFIGYEKICRDVGEGVKALFVYPTKALANDQLEEIAEVLYEISRRTGVNISFGIFHGGTKSLYDLYNLQSDEILPVSCPIHGGQVILEPREIEEGKVEVKCLKEGKVNEDCDFARFLEKAMRKTRDEIYWSPPDILITDEDMINRVLSGAFYSRHKGGSARPWWEWQLFGYPYKRCRICHHTYPYHLNLRKCLVCKREGSLESIEKVSTPRIIVIDEAHQLHGSFGAQVHHLFSLLEHILRTKPLYVLSSATLAKPKLFVKSLLRINEEEVAEVKAEESNQQAGGGYKRVFAFVMPKTYTKDATTIRLIEKFIEEFSMKSGKQPKGIVFTNTLAESNDLVHMLKDSRRIIDILHDNRRIGGHTTDYEEERANIEVQFKKGDIDWLVATSTLEVGVDYGVVDAVIIYGMPYRVTSFIQRVGRAGRKKDAAVFVIFNPDNPMDYNFYESYKILSDGGIREKAIEHEIIEISPFNEEVLRRATMRWLIAEIRRICASDNPRSSHVCKLLVGNVEPYERENAWKIVIAHLTNASPPMSLNVQPTSSITSIINSQKDNIIRSIKSNLRSLMLDNLIEKIGWESLHNLRGADEVVEIRFPDGEQRRRELRVAIKRALIGEVIAYRGRFYMVNSVQQATSSSLLEWLSR